MRQIFYEEGTYHAIALTTSAALLTSQEQHEDRQGCVIQNLGSGIAYLGFDSSVSASTGLELVADDKISIDGPVNVYGVSASTSDIRVWELK